MFSHTSLKKLEILLFLALIVGGFYYLYTLYALGAATVNVTPRDPLCRVLSVTGPLTGRT